MGRSAETIRQVIKRFDERYPEAAMFALKSRSLSKESTERIYQQHISGASFEKLAQDYGRSKNQIIRVVQHTRAEQIMQLPLEYMSHPDFERKDAEGLILGPMPPSRAAVERKQSPAGLSPYLASLYEHPLLTHAQEVYLFRKYNFLKYRANKLRDELDLCRPKARLLDEIESLYRQIVETKNQIIRANLRLVVSIAKKYAERKENFFDLVSDGNISLMKAVEKYDFGRGFKFSTYATWALRKNFAREFANRIRRSDRFRTSHEELLGTAADERVDHFEQEFAQQRREHEVGQILGCLSDREREIIKKRFGLNGCTHPYTLQEVGKDLGVSKERIRQIESRALAKLHEAAEAEKIESA
jgi:RNA polymerase primary sigma factor/RNA polymerase sigma factor